MKLDKLLKQLNPEQRHAVDKIDGPVMVIAGPGTGKTTLLSARVGNIMQETDTDPHNILCLTFSESGRMAMKDRLVNLFGPIGHRIHVYTFHGFANKVLQENTHLIGIQDMQPATELQKTMVMSEIIDSTPIHSPLRSRGDMYYYQRPMRHLFHLMKSENWTREHIMFSIKDHQESLEHREEFRYKRANKKLGIQVGDIKEAAVSAEMDKMGKVLHAVEYFDAYNTKMKEHRIYDFDDMLGFAVNSFEKYSYMLNRYQEQYLYFLVDEFQDTNGIQFKLLNQLTSYWGRKANVFVVGDDDQSVYEFQGARIQNITDFANSYPEIETIHLKVNYRSRQNIIDLSTNVITKNVDRLSNALRFEKKFTSSSKERAHIGCYNFENENQELCYLLDVIETHDNPSELAIIYSKHSQAERLIKLLDAKDIPYRTSRKVNVLHTGVFQMMMELLELFSSDIIPNHLAWKYMSYPFTDHKEELKSLERNWTERLLAQEDFYMLYSLMRGYETSSVFSDFAEKVGILSGLLDWSKQSIREYSAYKTMMSFFIENTKSNGGLDFKGLKRLVDKMEENNISLPVEYIDSDEKGVTLTTSHACKGLEFDDVFMMDCGKRWEPGRSHGGKFSLPPTLTHSNIDTTEEAARRAFYVSMTRARKFLVMTYSGIERCLFLDEAIFDSSIEVEKYEYAVTDILVEHDITSKVFNMLGQEEVERRIKNFVWSFSSLQKWIDDKEVFLDQYILKTPSAPIPPFRFGDAMHDAFHRYTMDMRKAEPRKYGHVADLTNHFYDYMDANASDFDPQRFKFYKYRGQRAITFYWSLSNMILECRSEQSIRNVEINGIPVKGIIDRMDFIDDQECTIVDYKTGTYTKSKFKPYSGIYWRQGIFMAMLLRAQEREAWFSKKVEFHYLEEQKKHKDVVIHEVIPDIKAYEHVENELIQADKELKELTGR